MLPHLPIRIPLSLLLIGSIVNFIDLQNAVAMVQSAHFEQLGQAIHNRGIGLVHIGEGGSNPLMDVLSNDVQFLL